MKKILKLFAILFCLTSITVCNLSCESESQKQAKSAAQQETEKQEEKPDEFKNKIYNLKDGDGSSWTLHINSDKTATLSNHRYDFYASWYEYGNGVIQLDFSPGIRLMDVTKSIAPQDNSILLYSESINPAIRDGYFYFNSDDAFSKFLPSPAVLTDCEKQLEEIFLKRGCIFIFLYFCIVKSYWSVSVLHCRRHKELNLYRGSLPFPNKLFLIYNSCSYGNGCFYFPELLSFIVI